MENINFSVVIPLYNNRDYILRAVESALTQSVPPLEVIVVDDGSTDGGASTLEGIGVGLLRIITQDNCGVGAARNAGMVAARGEWIALLDADDAWLCHHLEEVSRLAKQFPDAGLLGTSYIELPTNQRHHDDAKYQKTSTLRKVDYFLEESRRIGFICSSAVAIRSDVFYATGGFGSSRTGEDTEFWARVALNYPVAVSNRVTSIYYRGTGGVMETPQRHLPQNALHTLDDVAPVMAMLCNEARDKPTLFKSPSIRSFINGRLALGIKSNIYQGNIARARKMAAMMLSPINIRWYLWLIVLAFPNSVLIATARIYRNGKSYLT